MTLPPEICRAGRSVRALAALLLLAGCAGCSPGAAQGQVARELLPPVAATRPVRAATPTPFQPVPPTPTAPAVPLPQQPTPTPSDPFLWNGLDLHAGGPPLALRLGPAGVVNGGLPVDVHFQAGARCAFEDHRACVTPHFGGRVLLITIHSGVGGEGQPLRHALEGTGLNRAGLALAQVQANLAALRGAPAQVEQGGAIYAGSVAAAARVPASLVDFYYSRPVEEALEAFARVDPGLQMALESQRPLILIETCAWKHPEEAWAPGVTDTTGGVYLVGLW